MGDENQTLIENCPLGDKVQQQQAEEQTQLGRREDWSGVKEFTVEYVSQDSIEKASSVENGDDKSKRGKQFQVCPVCSTRVLKRGLDRHMRTHNKSFLCSLCPALFANDANRLVHERNSHGQPLDHHLIKANNLLTCDVCEKVFMSMYHLQAHKSSHTKEKMYPCDKCGKSYASKSNLKSHKKIHDGSSKVFGCPFDKDCTKRFSHRSEVKQHKSVHSGNKEYKCIHCGNLYSRYPSLWRHTKKCTFNPAYGKSEVDEENGGSFELEDTTSDSVTF